MTTIQKARRVAKRAGFRVCKSRERSQHWNNRGQLQLINDRNCVVLGFDFDASPEEVVRFCRAEVKAPKELRRAAKLVERFLVVTPEQHMTKSLVD